MAIKLEINQRVQIRSSRYAKTHDKPFYASRIEEEDAEFLYIAEPLDGTVPVFLPLGEEIEVIFFNEKGAYLFKSIVLGRVERNIRLLRIAKPDTVEKTNRRDFFRLKVFIPFSFRILDDDTYQHGFPESQVGLRGTVLRPQIARDEADKYEGIIKDLSGGGALVAVSDKLKLKVNDHLEMWLPLGYDTDLIYLWGDVVRVTLNPEAGKWNHDVGISFNKITERDRDSIIAHILNLQRDLLQKGALQSEEK